MQQLSQLDYEAIENAVMETARGRWFLAEYKKRHAAPSTTSLLDAISRLEKVVTTLGDGSYKSSQPAQEEQSPEAKPAEKAQTKAFTAPTPFFASKSDNKDADLAETKPVVEPTALNDENLKFFSNDEDLFSDDANDLLPDAAPAIDAAPADATPIKEASAPELAPEPVPTIDTPTPEMPKSVEATAVPEPSQSKLDTESKLDAETADISDRFKVFRTETSAQTTTPDADANADKTEIGATDAQTQGGAEPDLDALLNIQNADNTAEAVSLEPAAGSETVEQIIEPTPEPAAPAFGTKTETVPDPAMDATNEEKDRIVIIRGNSDKGIDIPFADDIFGDKQDKSTAS